MLKIDALRADVQLAHKKINYALWEEWSPKDYLKTYFAKLGQDSYENIRFLQEKLSKFSEKPKQKILDFGCGPTIFAGLLAAPYANEIHMTDYLKSNLLEIQKWLNAEADAFDWSNCARFILTCEGSLSPQADSEKRMQLLRRLTKKLLRCDASQSYPLIDQGLGRYPLIISNFCADSATSSKDVWAAYMKNIFNLLEPGGTLLIAALRNCSYYKNGENFFPCANINEVDLYSLLIANGFLHEFIDIEICQVPQCKIDGFTSVIFAEAKLSPDLQQARDTFSKISKWNSRKKESN